MGLISFLVSWFSCSRTSVCILCYASCNTGKAFVSLVQPLYESIICVFLDCFFEVGCHFSLGHIFLLLWTPICSYLDWESYIFGWWFSILIILAFRNVFQDATKCDPLKLVCKLCEERQGWFLQLHSPGSTSDTVHVRKAHYCDWQMKKIFPVL